MAFLDNSGDIILDAVLTDLGRRRLAQGNFRITKFALGDDEIDYGLFNRDHASGSSYYDLEIMQTPVFEAFTQTNANINYGLTSHTRTDLLYLPVIKANNLVNTAADLTSSVYYLATNSETASKLRTYHSASKYVLESNQVSDTQVVLESGIDNNTLTDNSTNRSAYIVNTNLLDTSFNVHADGRFIVSLLTAPKGGTFRNTSAGAASINLSPMKRV
tara:strand:+ start:1070 stop:1720 length:651 start_codon:yes stop_codon:yes gene_type:complete